MRRLPRKLREEARELFLTGEINSVAEIARRLKVKAHTVGQWKKEEDWDGLRIRIERRAAEQMVEKLASERVTLNTQHFKLWGAVVSKVFGALTKEAIQRDEVRELDRVANILEKAQRGQRLARGLALDGQTEEMIRAESAAEARRLIDLFIGVVKAEVADEMVRDRIARRLLEELPVEEELAADA
jgi:hypothetical protein